MEILRFFVRSWQDGEEEWCWRMDNFPVMTLIDFKFLIQLERVLGTMMMLSRCAGKRAEGDLLEIKWWWKYLNYSIQRLQVSPQSLRLNLLAWLDLSWSFEVIRNFTFCILFDFWENANEILPLMRSGWVQLSLKMNQTVRPIFSNFKSPRSA